MTSAYWFQYKPSDEREEALLSKARWAALSFLWTTLSMLFAVTVVVSENGMVSVPAIMLSILAIEFGSYITGWWVIRHETFEDRSMPHIETYSITRLLILLTITSIALVGMVALFPALYYMFGAVWFIVPVVLLAFFTWKQTVGRTTAVRIFLTILAPFTFGYLRSPRPDRSIRVCHAIAFFLFWMIFTNIPTLFVRATISEPIYVTTERFVDQGYNQNSFYLLDKTAGIHEGDIVVTESKHERILQQVFRIDEQSFVYLMDGVENTAPKQVIVGALLPTFPLKNLVNSLLQP